MTLGLGTRRQRRLAHQVRVDRRSEHRIGTVPSDKEPILITQHGLPSAYLVDVETYEAQQRRMNLLEGIARGEKAIEKGRIVSHTQAKKRLGRWLK